MEFNKEKFSKFVMDRPYLGQIKPEEIQEGERTFSHALDKAGCGDSYEIYIKLNKENKITDAKYITYGCGYAQATCCALIEGLLNEKLEDVSSWSAKEVENKIESVMGEFPIHKKAYMFFAKELLDGVCQKALSNSGSVV
jgi:NifU-like protein involved in Fe-S cluster formation